MHKSNKVFIAQSLDGYISDRNNELGWLEQIPNPDHIDMGYKAFVATIDAIVMGRKTFETVCSFGIAWPYSKPVFVLSRNLKSIPPQYTGKAELVSGSVQKIIQFLNKRGYLNLYIDGGTTINSFLSEDLIDEMIITTIPILLGGGSRLFDKLPMELSFEHIETRVFLNQIVQNRYRRKR